MVDTDVREGQLREGIEPVLDFSATAQESDDQATVSGQASDDGVILGTEGSGDETVNSDRPFLGIPN